NRLAIAFDGDDVEIESAWPPPLPADPAGVGLDPLETGDQVGRFEIGGHHRHRVEVGVLLGAADRGRFVESGEGDDISDLLQPPHRLTQRRVPVAEVGAEGYRRPIGHRVRCTVTATSRKGISIGAWGLWIVTVAALTRSSAMTTPATRSATRSIRFQRSPLTVSATCSVRAP